MVRNIKIRNLPSTDYEEIRTFVIDRLGIAPSWGWGICVLFKDDLIPTGYNVAKYTPEFTINGHLLYLYRPVSLEEFENFCKFEGILSMQTYRSFMP